ncbi:MAG TPA: alpha/beta hydrolase, partial [Rhodobacteraceae bacterium]|nr:alpha/beta hydrolase [Paracoccaceae bacterium]
MLTAPLYNDAAEAPPGGKARWVTTSDDIRLRFAWWDVGEKGTVLIFPGRTEFVEKYGRTVRDFLDADYASVVIDWRGQGLSDRLTPNRLLGHVGQFSDYQLDIAA